MKFTLNAIVVAIFFLGLLGAILFFGIKWSLANAFNEEIMAVKPWQPFFRGAFTCVIFTMTCIFVGALIRVLGNRE